MTNVINANDLVKRVLVEVILKHHVCALRKRRNSLDRIRLQMDSKKLKQEDGLLLTEGKLLYIVQRRMIMTLKCLLEI